MHLTDEQLNEYLDNESTERAQIESHLAECADCSARLTALKALFIEIESLPEITPSRSLAPRLTAHAPVPPPWLMLIASLQAAIAVITIIIGAPFVMQFITPYLSGMQTPSFAELFLQFQSGWIVWLDILAQLQVPMLPEIPVVELSSLVIVLTLAGVSALWLVGNGLLLRNHIK